jgi:hypothetical protein
VPGDDFGERVRHGEVDALERSHDGALRRAERRWHDAEPDVGASLGRGFIEGAAQTAEGPLTAAGSLLEEVDRIGRAAGARLPDRGIEPGASEALAQLATDRHLDLEEIRTGVDREASLVQGAREVRLADRRTRPRPGRLAQDIDQLRTGRSRRSARPPRR